MGQRKANTERHRRIKRFVDDFGNGPPVLIEWVDSHSGRGWRELEDLKSTVAEPLYCRSIGWVVQKNEECVILVPHIAGEKNGDASLLGCGDLVIPAKAIFKETVLRSD